MYGFCSSFIAPVGQNPSSTFCAHRKNVAVHATPVRSARMVLRTEDETALRITGNNIAITQSLRTYVSEKLSKVTRKYKSLITKIDVHLTVEHNPAIATKHKAEVLVFAGKTILRSETRSVDMYAAIDEVEEKIARTLRKYKERKFSKSKHAKNSGRTNNVPAADFVPAADPVIDEEKADDEDDEFNGLQDEYAEDNSVAPGVPSVTAVVKRKVFPMPLQTVEEAVLCCEYVDHPWYLFRNAETKEISLVYKRNHGGYGLIEPANPNATED